MIEVDARNCACPIPVLWTQKAMEQDETATIAVFLNDAVARYNVSAFAHNNDYNVKEEIIGNEFKLYLTPRH